MIARPPVERPILWPHAAPDEHWHTEVQTVFRYWRERHPANGLPGRQHIDPLDVVGLLPGIWPLDVQREPFRVRYRLVGTRVTESIGREVTGLWMDEAHPDALGVTGYFDRYRSVVDSAQPSWRKGRTQLYIHEDYAHIENILLPLARDGQHVDMLFVLTAIHETPVLAVPA